MSSISTTEKLVLGAVVGVMAVLFGIFANKSQNNIWVQVLTAGVPGMVMTFLTFLAASG